MNLILLAQAAGEAAPGSANDALRADALEKIRHLQLTDLNGQDWIYAAEYYGLRAIKSVPQLVADPQLDVHVAAPAVEEPVRPA